MQARLDAVGRLRIEICHRLARLQAIQLGCLRCAKSAADAIPAMSRNARFARRMSPDGLTQKAPRTELDSKGGSLPELDADASLRPEADSPRTTRSLPTGMKRRNRTNGDTTTHC